MHHPAASVIRNVRVSDASAVDIRIADGVITSVEPATPQAPSADAGETGLEIDGRGMLALPGLVNTHAHIDKSWWGLQFVRHGTTAIRTHVDVDLGVAQRGIEAVREAVAAYDGALQVQIVAFPQDGVLRRPGVIDLLDEAAAAGAEFIGGLDPASIDRDPVGQLDALFRVAADRGVGIDLHLHDPAELGAFQIELIIERTERLGLAGRVNLAHGFALAQVGASHRRDLLQAMAALDITMTTVAPLRLAQLPLHELDAAGVRFGFGTDGIRDLWSPYGTGDLLGIAWQYARASSLVRDDDLRRVVDIATGGSAPFAG
ncbi:MAG: cytosine deaminase, partial [Microbacterium sp.]|nr:cytosine deaminase [Microbacterium sp.]